MNSNNSQPQPESLSIQKLEEDLQDLSQEAKVNTPVEPQINTNFDSENFKHEVPQKTSSSLKIAITFLIISTLALVAYIFKDRFLSETLVNTPTPKTASPVPTLDPTANWNTYTSLDKKFSFKYPADYLLDTSKVSPYLNNNITWEYNSISQLDCRGDCPLVEKTTDVVIGGIKAKKMEGYIGEIGGNIAQRFVNYEFNVDGKYLLFTLQVTPLYLSNEDYKKYYVPGKILEINDQDIIVFDQILSTFKFLAIEM